MIVVVKMKALVHGGDQRISITICFIHPQNRQETVRKKETYEQVINIKSKYKKKKKSVNKGDVPKFKMLLLLTTRQTFSVPVFLFIIFFSFPPHIPFYSPHSLPRLLQCCR
uniref:Uncharacterized protein n=1 Tax=Trypanosoma vivax (strain Y486) TaxID=1055687 RepID=G0TY76_TRYVY|nr:hypothetical protein, unlikely [Trypanosoma vivax Y486]